MLLGDRVFGALGQPMPVWYQTNVNDNKMVVLFGAFFVLNGLINSCMSTGAFEVSLDNTLVWSKLNTGIPPAGNPNWGHFMDKLEATYRAMSVKNEL